MKRLVALCLPAALAAASTFAQQIPDRATLDLILGPNQTLEDFESYSINFGAADNLAVVDLNATSIANSQGPNLVAPGASYIDPSGNTMQWNGDLYFGIASKSILANAAIGGQVDIEYNTFVQAFGVDLTNFQNYPSAGTVTVRDISGALLGAVPFNLQGNPNQRVFVGWQDASGIGSVEIQHGNASWSPIIDDHGYGAFEGGGPTLFCDPANPHTGGLPATLDASSFAGPGVYHLECIDGPPDEFGYFLVSATVVDPGSPVSNGMLCLGLPIGRYAPASGGAFNSLGQFDAGGILQNIVGTSAAGSGFDVPIDLPTPPGGTIDAGETWYFQCWYRDGNRSNFSNAIAVAF